MPSSAGSIDSSATGPWPRDTNELAVATRYDELAVAYEATMPVAVLWGPQPQGLQADASITAPYGTASVAWSISGTTLTVNVALPPGTTGQFSAPEGWRCTTRVSRLGSGDHRLVLHSGS
jgi:hypothetical protein